MPKTIHYGENLLNYLLFYGFEETLQFLFRFETSNTYDMNRQTDILHGPIDDLASKVIFFFAFSAIIDQSQNWYFAGANWWFGIKTDQLWQRKQRIGSILMPNHQLAHAKYQFCDSLNERLMFRFKTKTGKFLKSHKTRGNLANFLHSELFLAHL